MAKYLIIEKANLIIEKANLIIEMAKCLDFTFSMTLDKGSIAKIVSIGGIEIPIQISCNFLL
jgi:hypothetical protein